MLDTNGIIEVTRLTQARHFDAARNLLYHNPARFIGLCESSQPHSAVERAFCVSSEDTMFKQCPICKKEFWVKPCHSWRVCCSRACRGEHLRQTQSGEQNPNYRPELTRICEGCGKPFRNYRKSVRFCSRACHPHVVGACRDCGISIRLKPSVARKLTREPYCNPCYQRHRAAAQAGTRLRVQTCDKCKQRFESAHHRRFCPACSPYQWDGVSPNATCVVCGKPYAHRNPKKRKTCSAKCSRENWGALRRGEKNYFWKGGVCPDDEKLRKRRAYKDWRAAVFQRDGGICGLCHVLAVQPVAHHILLFATYPDRRLDVANGITLCWSCHGRIRSHEDEHIEQFQAIVQSRG